jgi:hypothetical protein
MDGQRAASQARSDPWVSPEVAELNPDVFLDSGDQ